MAECKVIAAVNQKGGVGKTNLSTNLSIGLAQRGHKDCAVLSASSTKIQ